MLTEVYLFICVMFTMNATAHSHLQERVVRPRPRHRRVHCVRGVARLAAVPVGPAAVPSNFPSDVREAWGTDRRKAGQSNNIP